MPFSHLQSFQTELLDEFRNRSPERTRSSSHEQDIGFGRADFTWSLPDPTGVTEPDDTAFILHAENDVVFKQGGFNLIVGPTGSGKTSVLLALLDEMHYIPTTTDSWVNLPREGGVAYVAQESWIRSQTIKAGLCTDHLALRY